MVEVKGALAAAMRPRRFNRAGGAVALSAPRRSDVSGVCILFAIDGHHPDRPHAEGCS